MWWFSSSLHCGCRSFKRTSEPKPSITLLRLLTRGDHRCLRLKKTVGACRSLQSSVSLGIPASKIPSVGSTVHDIAALARPKERITTQGGFPHGSDRKRCAIFPRILFQKAQTIPAWRCKPPGDQCPGRSARRARAHHANPDPDQRHCLRGAFICRRRPI